MNRYLAQPTYMKKGCGSASSDLTYFVVSPWEPLLSLRSEWEVGKGRRGEWKEEQERTFILVCKIKAIYC